MKQPSALRRISSLVALCLLLTFAAGCGNNAASPPADSSSAQSPSESGSTPEVEGDTSESQSNGIAETESSARDDENNDAMDAQPSAGGSPVVYMTTDISPAGLAAVYEALGWTPTGRLAVKVSTGEPPASNYLRQELIGEFVRSLDGTYVECNTAYGGSRAETAMHYQVAEDHGFTPVDIMDENGSIELTVNNGDTLGGVNYVGANFANYDSMIVLSHFKGHGMAGFGGAIKNISIGVGSSMGKVWIHTGGERTSGGIMGDSDPFQRAMAEAGLSVSDALGNGENSV